MANRREQLGLFGPVTDGDTADTIPVASTKNRIPAPALAAEDIAAAQHLSPRIRLGTSSWSFPGWQGIVWDASYSERELARDGLVAYSRHPILRTVGVDRSYYAPVEKTAWEAYARQVAPSPDFRFVAKAWNEVTTMVFPSHPKLGARAGQKNPSFLDPAMTLEQIVTPYLDGLGALAGPLVFEIPPHPAPTPDEARRLAETLDVLLAALPRHGHYAIELRNRAFLTPRYLRVLAAHGAGHVFNFWAQMPTVGEQLGLPRIIGDAPFVVARLMLPPGETYDSRKAEMAPFNRIVDRQAAMRADVVTLAERTRERGAELYILINNKAEGSAPLTARALAEALAGLP